MISVKKEVKQKKNKKNINKNKKTKYEEIKNKVKDFILKYYYILLISLPFILIDIITKILGYKIHFYGIFRLVPCLFTLTYIILMVGISLFLEKKKGKIVYTIFFILAFALFITNNIYYSMTNTFFDFSLIMLAGEGSDYFMDAILNCNIWVYISSVVIIISYIFGLKQFKERKKTDLKKIIKVFFLFLILHLITPLFLGKPNDSLTWSTWRNPRNIYINFNDNNKSMMVSGIYEYSVRNFYITFIKAKKTDNEEDITFLKEEYNKEEENYQTSYTGKFKDKNVIFLQLEGTDNWLITKEDTPTLYNMMNNSINFTNHYSYYNGGGSTFNSEFAVNTGFITPLSYTQNAYSFNKNSFPYSLAKLLKNENYSVNAFHMNDGEYYSRATNYKNWGYDNYYGLKELGTYKDDSYTLDRELILNETFKEKMFSEEELPSDYVLPTMSEEDCARRQAKETDYMVELLINTLTEKNLIDNTVIVVFTDHYLYTLSDQTILDKYKDTSNNLINHTPFFIWDNGNTKKKVTSVTSQLNILPTIINLLGLEYHPNYYIGKDALNGNYIIRKNDLTLKYNYFKKISTSKDKEV